MRPFDITQELQDMTGIDWSERSRPSTVSGTFLKARTGSGTRLTYYKLSNYDSYRGIFGHECVNELIASRLLRALAFPHVDYRLIHAMVRIDGNLHETWLNASKSFRKPGSRKMPFDQFYELHRTDGESPLELCDRYGWGTYIRQMMLTDYLIINRDRHGANIELIRAKDGSVSPAPLFDNGLSFVCTTYGNEARIAAFDPLADLPANNFIGGRSLEENLQYVPAGLASNPFERLSKEELFAGLDDVLSEAHRDKIWEILTKRWEHYELACV